MNRGILRKSNSISAVKRSFAVRQSLTGLILIGEGLAGAQVEKYGAAALPGAMFMLAYLGDIPVMGVPACGMFFKITVVDLMLPRLLAGERVSRRDIVALACGGLCRACPECRYPNCTSAKARTNLSK